MSLIFLLLTVHDQREEGGGGRQEDHVRTGSDAQRCVRKPRLAGSLQKHSTATGLLRAQRPFHVYM